MTDEDRALLVALQDLTITLGPFGLAILEDTATARDELAMAMRMMGVTHRILQRAASHRCGEDDNGDEGGPVGSSLPTVY